MTGPLPANLAGRDGELYYRPAFIQPASARELFECLHETLDWQQEDIVIAGRRIKVPRLVCWYGDTDAVYRYSGVVHRPLPWPAILLELKRQIETYSGWSFNSMLGNLYRDGNDSMGWHADKERELGDNPRIASLSLGAHRLFRLRHRLGERQDLELEDGSLLLMGGKLQHHWRHCLPKTRQPTGPRINLTFRFIISANPQGHGHG